jgi:hypothetical protein
MNPVCISGERLPAHKDEEFRTSKLLALSIVRSIVTTDLPSAQGTF